MNYPGTTVFNSVGGVGFTRRGRVAESASVKSRREPLAGSIPAALRNRTCKMTVKLWGSTTLLLRVQTKNSKNSPKIYIINRTDS